MEKYNRIKKHLKLFLSDHFWIIILFFASPVVLMLFYLIAVKEAPDTDWFYYSFLSGFLLICFLGWRLYITWNLYELFCSEKRELEDFLLFQPKCGEERHFHRIFFQLYRLHAEKMQNIEAEKKQNKLMIYRWVHQMKTPLSVIRLIAEKNRVDPDLKKISRSAGEIQYDLDQILNMYKLDAVKNDFHVEQVHLPGLIKEEINELKSEFIEKGIYPKLESKGDYVIYSDRKWLKFVLYQLLTNALKYSDRGSCIRIKVFCVKTDIVLSVEDEGCGIQVEDLPRIFELFFTGKNGRSRGESTGIGLYMVKKILDYLGYEIRVESNVGTGSRFQVIFDRQEETVEEYKRNFENCEDQGKITKL